MTVAAIKFPAAVRATAPQHFGDWDIPVESAPTKARKAYFSYEKDVDHTFPIDRNLPSLSPTTCYWNIWGSGNTCAVETWVQPKSQRHQLPFAPVVARSSTPIVSFILQLTTEIGRLNDGWDGPGSAAPSEDASRSLMALAHALPAQTQEPEADVDSSDGSVALRWTAHDNLSTFSLRLDGQRIICTYSRLQGAPDGAIFTRDQITPIARYLSNYDFLLTHA
jgi:hypothetical protein